MTGLLSSNRFLLAASVGLLIVGCAFSFAGCNFQWLSRFGALIICAGVIALARPSLIRADILPSIIMADTGLDHLDPAHYKKLNEPIPNYVIEDKKSRFAVGILGPVLCFVGTAISGFADLLNKLLGW